MRAVALLVLVAGLFAASQAIDLKEIGTQLVGNLVETGKQALKDVLGGLINKLGKRDMSLLDTLKEKAAAIKKKLSGLLDELKAKGSVHFKDAIDKLKLAAKKIQEHIGMVKNSKDADKVIDGVVDDHSMKQKRVLDEIIQKGKDFLSGYFNKTKDFASAIAKGWSDWHAKSNEIISGVIQKGIDLVGKRGLTDHLKTIGNALSSAVSPFKDIVSGLGNTLKGHFSNLVNTVKGHALALKDKLAGHVDDLKTSGKKLLEHGKNALGALSDVVKDILQQTVTNAKPHIDSVAKTLSDAGKTVLNHLSGSDSKSF